MEGLRIKFELLNKAVEILPYEVEFLVSKDNYQILLDVSQIDLENLIKMTKEIKV